MSYTIEVYRGNQKPEHKFGIYALYVMFYPQLVAGPIERPQNILHQFYEKHSFDYTRVVSGLRMVLWGLVKKVVIADRLAIYVNAVFGNIQHHSAITLVIATFFCSRTNLLRFLRLFGDSAGNRAGNGFRPDGQFQKTLFCQKLPGALATLAYLTYHLVQRLFIFSFGRYPQRSVTGNIQFNICILCKWSVARRQLDVCALGNDAGALCW